MIGERLQDIRKDHNDTQQDLADKLHASLYAARCWEQGKSDPSHDTLIAICKLYGVSADFLLGLTDEDPVYRQRRQKSHLIQRIWLRSKGLKRSYIMNRREIVRIARELQQRTQEDDGLKEVILLSFVAC